MLIIVFLVCHHTRLLQLRAAVLKSDKGDSLLIAFIMPWNETVTSQHWCQSLSPEGSYYYSYPKVISFIATVLRRKLIFTAKESTGLEEPRDSPKELPQRQIAGQSGEYSICNVK